MKLIILDSSTTSKSIFYFLQKKNYAILPLTCGAFFYTLLSILTITPITNMTGTPAHGWPSKALYWFGRWLPVDLHLAINGSISRQNTGYAELMLLLLVLFALYGLCALIVYRLRLSDRRTYALIWLATVAVGGMFLLSRGILASDIYSYASYGRLLAFHSANPYFIPPSAFPHDPVYPLLYWTDTVTIYGPIWTLVSAGLMLISGSNQLYIILAFRIFALCAHLANIALVTAILRATGRTERVVALGTLLYAWNPLVLSESALGGHNDVFMVTFILLGFLLWVRAERTGILLRPRGYLPAMLVLTLSILVKFSSAPIIIVAVLALFFKVLRTHREKLGWLLALRKVLTVSTICVGVILAFYLPFWLGHTIAEIINSFTSLPSAQSAFNSLLFTLTSWNNVHPFFPAFAFLLDRKLWNVLTLVMMAIPLLTGLVALWRAPTIHTITLTSLACVSAFLIVTPWFFAWYATWIVGLAVICLPLRHKGIAYGLVTFAFTFSATAFLTYYSTLIGVLLLRSGHASWTIVMIVSEIGIPVLVSVCVLRLWHYGILSPRQKMCSSLFEESEP